MTKEKAKRENERRGSIDMIKLLEALAYELRLDVLEMIFQAQTGHIGSDYSVMEILTALYMKEMNITPELRADEDRDYFVLSKGHAVEAYYAVLAKKGFLDRDEVIREFSRFGSKYIGHPNNKIPGIEMNSGSLGHGLPVCVGIAKACRMNGRPNRVYTVMGDGELAEGSVWEGVMAASHYGLDNLCAVVDRNRLQISGSTEDVMHHENLADRFAAFGWNVIETDGHKIGGLLQAFQAAREKRGMPTVVIADTVKGKGVSFMEDQAEWHHKVPNASEYIQAKAELERKKEALSNE